MWLDSTTTMVVASLAAAAAGGFSLEFRRQRAARKLVLRVGDHGGDPPSLHPKIDPARCVGCGACVEACPEDDVLRVVDGHARLVNASHCVGHGRCKDVCPTSAIELVFGTAARGVTVPLIDLAARLRSWGTLETAGGFGAVLGDAGTAAIPEYRSRWVRTGLDLRGPQGTWLRIAHEWQGGVTGNELTAELGLAF